MEPVQSSAFFYLLLSQVPIIWADLQNIALNKPAKQSSRYSNNDINGTAGVAVNGDAWTNNDFSHTEEKTNQWWAVDLMGNYTIGIIELVNREGYNDRLSRISILTSLDVNPPDPFVDLNRGERAFNSHWIEQSYSDGAYGPVGVISLPNITARQLAVFSSAIHGVTLREVYIYQSVCFNIAEKRKSSQSSTFHEVYPSEKGNDGVIQDGYLFSHTEASGSQWWRVDLGSHYFVYRVVIYGRTDCCKDRYIGWSVLTSNETAESDPIEQGSLWRIQANITDPIGTKRDLTFTAVSARHVAVANPATNPHGIVLRELQVYGCQCVLDEVVNRFTMVTSSRPGCVTLSWNLAQTLCANANFQYNYQCEEQSWTNVDNRNSQDVCYSSSGGTVTCLIRACLGGYCAFKKLEATTAECYEPSIPAHLVSDQSTADKTKQQLPVKISWQAAQANCYGDIVYSINITGPKDSQILQSSSTSYSINLDLCSSYNVSVTAINKQSKSSTAHHYFSTQSIGSPVLEDIKIESINTSCFLLSWKLPEYQAPGLCSLKTLTGWCSQTTEKKTPVHINQPDTIMQSHVCGFQTSSGVTCILKTTNMQDEASESFTAQASTTEKSLIIIIASVVPIVLLIIITALIIFLLWRSGKCMFKKPKDSAKDQVSLREVKVTSLLGTAAPVNQASIYENFRLQEPTTEIQVEELEGFIEDKRDQIKHQFQRLADVKLAGVASEASKPENNGKNKYKDLYPANQWRVLLDKTETQDGSDYINASYMKGYEKENKYIAAQGPTKKTINDFWLMIWQVKPSAIVMLTKTYEAGKNKCEKYWPEEKETVAFNKISVTSVLIEDWADFTIRTMQVSKGDEKVRIKLFHFLSWPDHGAPKESTPFIMFCRFVFSFTKKAVGPVIVHCSAGVGRTGTFIALNYLIDEARATGKLDPFCCIKQMRERRPSMIQNEEQYNFLYEALLEFILTEKFICTANQLPEKIKNFNKGAATGSPMIVTEFKRICKLIGKNKSIYETGMMTVNRIKNRFQHILPNDLHRPFVGLKGQAGSYINAVLVDGYRRKDFVICTQLPLQETLSDFWQLVLYQESFLIIQLDEDELPFYPVAINGESTFKNVTVTCNSLEKTDSCTTYRLSIDNKQKQETVLLMKVKTPPNNLPRIGLTVSILEAAEKNIQQMNSKTVIFTSLDGAEKCGLFCCAMNALHKLKAEQEVDIYHTVLSARYRRPEFIISQEEYVWLYTVIEEYINSFMEYSNFREIDELA